MFKSITTNPQAFSVVSTNISKRLGTSADLDKFASGVVDTYMPNTYNEYSQYRRFMHDILCLSMIEAGLYASEELTLSKLKIKTNDQKLMSQKPDLFTVSGDVLRVCEVTLTFDVETATNTKNSKYNELWSVIQSNSNYIVQYSPLIVDLSDAEWKDNLPSIPDLYLRMLTRFVENLVNIHTISTGESFRQQLDQDIIINFPFKYEMEPIIQKFESYLNCNIDPDLFFTYVKGWGKLDLESNEVKSYFDKLSDHVLNMTPHDRPFPHPKPRTPVNFIVSWDKFKSVKSNTVKTPVVLQLGAPTLTDEIDTLTKSEIYNELTTTNKYGGYLDLIKSTPTTIKEFLDSGIVKLPLTDEQLKIEMMDGPGRKKYIKSNNIKADRKPPTHIGINSDHVNDLEELIDLFNSIEPSEFLQRQLHFDVTATGSNLDRICRTLSAKLNGNGFDYLLQFYSRLSTEITLNAMRRRKARHYTIGHSGFDGIYFLIAPGPQLRTESNVVFIKIISMIEPIQHKLSRSWDLIGDHYESPWISVDTDRLKHWVRSRHRVNLSILSCAEKLLSSDNTLESCLDQEINYGNYGLMSLIYLEDKSTTSTAIQTTRYVFMKSLGDKLLDKILEKFPQRVNSVIQSTIMQRMASFAVETCEHDTNNLIRLFNVKRDEELGTLDESTTGVEGCVPRIFTKGPYVPVKYSFNEIYWCMMYNKDRQNKTQDSMKILTKIAKEERKFNEEISSRATDRLKLSHAFGFHTIKEDIEHISSKLPESHYYSRLAVSIGVALQDVHPENFAPKTAWLSPSKLYNLLNKNLSEYATFKASVAQIVDQISLDDKEELSKIGKRTKCIELVQEMVVNENLTRACDVAMQFSGVNSVNFKTVIQIFKKNQIGGVREILILYIKARILINLTEEISRLLSKADKRETLTKGKDKRLMMRGDYEELTSSYPAGTPLMFIKNSYDMATWCQKFIPTIFLPIYNHHGSKLQELENLSEFVMLSHCLKEVEYPNKMIEQWMKHKDEVHDSEALEYYKRQFLSTGVPKMINFSNMGQGILHYNSTVMALSCQSFRDELFKHCLRKLGRPQSIRWKTKVGSDDKGETIAMDLTSDDYMFQAKLFEQCSFASERLHSMELSVKSASGHLIYEFNSAYMANLEVQSPIVKFTIAAVDMIGTDSCTNFINESYSRIRQLRENGGSSLLCMMAHLYNKHHFNEIFRTGRHMINDPCDIFGVPETNIPYDLGIYPIYDADIQDMIGPEYHNYTVFTDPSTPDAILRMLYTTSIGLKDDEILPSDDEGLFKKDNFLISMGLVKQLENMKSRLNLKREEIESYLSTNPLMLIRGPSNVEETAITIASKLFTRGAAQSLRRTSPVIYLGRLSAFETARAWKWFEHPDDEKPIKMTYKEYISNVYSRTSSAEYKSDIREFKPLIFPQHNSFEVVRQFVKQFGLREQTKRIFSQSIRTWVLNNYNYNFYHSLKDILETSMGFAHTASKADVDEMKKSIPFDITSYEGFIENCRNNNVRPLDICFYMMKFYKLNMTKRAQVFASGPTTSSLNLTLSNLKRYNHLVGSIMDLDVEVDSSITETALTKSQEFDTLKLAFNMLMLRTQGSLRHQDDIELLTLDQFMIGSQSLHSLCETYIRNMKNIDGLDQSMRKIVIFISSEILDKSEFVSKILSWKQLCYTYLKKQRKTANGSWVGDLCLLVNYSDECYTININSGHHYIEAMRLENTVELYQSLVKISKVLSLDFNEFFTQTTIKFGDYYKSGRGIYFSRSNTKNKQKLNITFNKKFRYSKIRDLTNFRIERTANKDSSTSLSLVEGDRRIVLSHYPGHYYPVEIPRTMKVNNELYVNGLRATKLFKQRQWFFNGRLYPFNTKSSIDILKYHVKLEFLQDVSIDSQSKIKEYIEDLDDLDKKPYEADEDQTNNLYSDLELKAEFDNKLDIVHGNLSIKELFAKASESFDISSWIQNTEKDVDLSNMQDDQNITMFVKALGENIHRKKKTFYTITNLRLNTTFMSRLLDLFFKSNSILSENAKQLPDYALHVMHVIEEEEGDPKLLNPLLKYITSRISTLTGTPIVKITDQLIKIKKTKRHFATLEKLNRLLSVDSPDLYTLLGSTISEEQHSDSEED